MYVCMYVAWDSVWSLSLSQGLRRSAGLRPRSEHDHHHWLGICMYVCMNVLNDFPVNLLRTTSVTWAGGVIGGRVTVAVVTVLRAEGLVHKILRYVCMYVCMYVYVMYISISVLCMYACMYVCMYVCGSVAGGGHCFPALLPRRCLCR